jgi:hypothetical protein
VKQKRSFMNQDFKPFKFVRSAALSIALIWTPTAAYAGGMKVGKALEVMDTKEIGAYTAGIVEGLAYARYVQDGKQPDKGMKCILEWYYDGGKTTQKVYLAYHKFKDHTANAIVAALIGKACP